MSKKTFNYKGLSCPAPLLRMSVALMKHEMAKGEVVEVLADCPFFPEGLKKWCEQTHSALLTLRSDAGTHVASVRVGEKT